jgi:hypothetical protein
MGERLTLKFDDISGLEVEAERRLSRGEAIVPGVTGLDAFMPCVLEIHHPNGGEPLEVEATVMTSPDEQERDGSVRLMLDGELGDQLDEFLSRAPDDALPDDLPDLDELVPVEDEDQPSDEESLAVAPSLRLRKLKVQEQIKLARTSQSRTERTALERILGRSGWEPLLANPHLTVPEVARIARKGTVPRPIVERIVANQTWIRAGTIRRALLSNPKMTTEMINRVLRATPGHELKLIRKQTAYPPAVRAAAERLFGR